MTTRPFVAAVAALFAIATVAHAQTQVPISQLPTAATPYAGTEILPCVQGGVTKSCLSGGLGTTLPGRLIGVQVFTANGTYTPDAGTNSIIVYDQGGGGAGGGVPATGSTQSGISGAGTPGAYAIARYTSGFSGVAVTIGAGGVGVVGGAGGNGGATSFGALLSCPGGPGGLAGAVSSGPITANSGASSSGPSGSGIILSGIGNAAITALQATGGVATVPNRQPSVIGGATFGYGGQGIAQGSVSQPAVSGINGGPGIMIIYEFS